MAVRRLLLKSLTGTFMQTDQQGTKMPISSLIPAAYPVLERKGKMLPTQPSVTRNEPAT
jgi:hypothetical protein